MEFKSNKLRWKLTAGGWVKRIASFSLVQLRISSTTFSTTYVSTHPSQGPTVSKKTTIHTILNRNQIQRRFIRKQKSGQTEAKKRIQCDAAEEELAVLRELLRVELREQGDGDHGRPDPQLQVAQPRVLRVALNLHDLIAPRNETTSSDCLI